jgi:hypothetical protein
MMEQPEGIIITVTAQTYQEEGYRNWLSCFLSEVENGWVYRKVYPKREVQFVYICIGGKIRFRLLFVCVDAELGVVMTGPVVRPKPGSEPKMKGMQGFRYTEKLF